MTFLKKFYLVLIALSFALSLAAPVDVMAQPEDSELFDTIQERMGTIGRDVYGGEIPPDPRAVAFRIINIFLSVLGVLLTGYVLYGGYVWMTAGGNEENVNKAKGIIRNGVIGVAIVLMAFAIAKFITVGVTCATNRASFWCEFLGY